MKSKVLGILATGTLLGPMSAHAINFEFSFTSTNPHPGTVPGTVTGRIIGLSDNSTGAASQVLIDSFPSDLNSVVGPAPIDATLWNTQRQNEFVVLNGQVIGGGFWADHWVVGLRPIYAQLFINGGFLSSNFLNLDRRVERWVWADTGLTAANIVPLAAVPEPSALVLLGLGMAGLGLSRRRIAA